MKLRVIKKNIKWTLQNKLVSSQEESVSVKKVVGRNIKVKFDVGDHE